MKRIMISRVPDLVNSLTFSQNFDFEVTANGDSIACSNLFLLMKRILE
jgi:hypothetical protein